MIPCNNYLRQSSQLPLGESNGAHEQVNVGVDGKRQSYYNKHDQANHHFRATSSTDGHMFLLPSTSKSQEQGDHGMDNQEQAKASKANMQILGNGPGDDVLFRAPSPVSEADYCNNGPVKWMSSKMRLMKKMMNSNKMVSSNPINTSRISFDHGDNNDDRSSSSNTTIRVCSDCNTTKTPLWRSGPQGPKSLCNACGIRRRKARQAMAAALVEDTSLSSTTTTTTTATTSTKSMEHDKRFDVGHDHQFKSTKYKKRSKTNDPRRRLHFDDFRFLSLSKNSAFDQVFPQDEKEAAILLMALSCDLIRS